MLRNLCVNYVYCYVTLHHATRFMRARRMLQRVSSKIVVPLVQWILRSNIASEVGVYLDLEHGHFEC